MKKGGRQIISQIVAGNICIIFTMYLARITNHFLASFWRHRSFVHSALPFDQMHGSSDTTDMFHFHQRVVSSMCSFVNECFGNAQFRLQRTVLSKLLKRWISSVDERLTYIYKLRSSHHGWFFPSLDPLSIAITSSLRYPFLPTLYCYYSSLEEREGVFISICFIPC